eukprot:symbB.v1.2.005410.t1/scaffold316.1/size230253/25
MLTNAQHHLIASQLWTNGMVKWLSLSGFSSVAEVLTSCALCLRVFGRAIVGCPLSAILRCEFCDAASFKLRWLTQVAAGAAGAVEIGIGNTLWVPQDAKGRTLHLEAEPDRSIAVSSRSKGTLRVGLVEEVDDRVDDRWMVKNVKFLSKSHQISQYQR